MQFLVCSPFPVNENLIDHVRQIIYIIRPLIRASALYSTVDDSSNVLESLTFQLLFHILFFIFFFPTCQEYACLDPSTVEYNACALTDIGRNSLDSQTNKEHYFRKYQG